MSNEKIFGTQDGRHAVRPVKRTDEYDYSYMHPYIILTDQKIEEITVNEYK